MNDGSIPLARCVQRRGTWGNAPPFGYRRRCGRAAPSEYGGRGRRWDTAAEALGKVGEARTSSSRARLHVSGSTVQWITSTRCAVVNANATIGKTISA